MSADLFGLDADGSPRPRKGTQPRGHAASPGTGPEGETCGTCNHLARLRYAKVYLKCELVRRLWTGGTATDVRARDKACRRWEAEEARAMPGAILEQNKAGS